MHKNYGRNKCTIFTQEERTLINNISDLGHQEELYTFRVLSANVFKQWGLTNLCYKPQMFLMRCPDSCTLSVIQTFCSQHTSITVQIPDKNNQCVWLWGAAGIVQPIWKSEAISFKTKWRLRCYIHWCQLPFLLWIALVLVIIAILSPLSLRGQLPTTSVVSI